jgi:adenosylmethionine-8-amino-7-oxononanoate aminotransferase
MIADGQSRRRHFEPILMEHTSRVSPCYPYRYRHEDETDEAYSQRLADELETEILRVGAGKVAAFFAETGKSPTPMQSAEYSRRCSSWQPHSSPWLFQGHQAGLRQIRSPSCA